MARNERMHMIWTAAQQHMQVDSRTRSRPIDLRALQRRKPS